MKKFKVIFNLYFAQTHNYDFDSDNSNTNCGSHSISSTSSDYEVDIDAFMLGSYHSSIPRYIEFIEGLSDTCECVCDGGGRFNSISYKDETITCIFTTNNDNLTKDDLIDVLKYNSLEDGEYEGEPGSSLVYPFGYLTGKYSYYTMKIGLIDYRDSFTVEELI